MELKKVSEQRYDIGRIAILGIKGGWNGTTNPFTQLVHYGNTEGAVDPNSNPAYSELTIESTGPAALKRYLTGERPEFDLSVYPNPQNLKVFSPTGRGSAGSSRQRPVVEHFLWLVAEALFLAPNANGDMVPVPVTYDAVDGFQKDGEDLSAEDQEHVDMSMMIWRADFGRLTPIYNHEGGGKALKAVPTVVQQDLTKPEGCQLYLMVGEAADFPDIDFTPAP